MSLTCFNKFEHLYPSFVSLTNYLQFNKAVKYNLRVINSCISSGEM